MSYPDSKVTVEEFKITPLKDGPVQVEMNGKLGNTPFSIKGGIGSINQLIDPGVRCPLFFVIQAAETELALEGTIKDPARFSGLEVSFKLSGENISSIGQLVGKELDLEGPFTFYGKIEDTSYKKFEAFNLRFVWRKSDLNGRVTLDLTQQVPHIKSELYSEYLDFRKILQNGGEKENGPVSAQKEESQPEEKNARDKKESERDKRKVFSKKPFDLGILKKANIDVKFRAEKTVFKRLALSNFVFRLNLEDGILQLDPLAAKAGGGKMKGRFQIETSENDAVFTALLDIDELDLNKMQKEMELKSLGEGTLEISLDLSGHGNSVADVMSSLDGNISLIMSEGWIDRDYLKLFDFIGTNLKASIFKVIGLPSKLIKGDEKQYSELNCFVIRFDVIRGNAEASAVVFDMPAMTVVGSGKIDLKKETLDIYLKPIPKEGIGAEGLGKLNLSLSQLAKPFKLGGTLADPNVVVDPAQTVVTLGKAIGGAALFGPAGIAVALLTGTFANAGNPCLAAVEAARNGVEVPEEKSGIFKKLGDFLKYLSPMNP